MTQTAASVSHWSVRTFLNWLVLACLLPGVIGASALFTYQYQESRAQLKRDTLQATRALVHAVDSHLLKVVAVAQTLAASNSLARGDFATFHQKARLVMELSGLGSNVVLRDQGGHQLLNTFVDFGKPLPSLAVPEQVRSVFAYGKPSISDVFIGPKVRGPIMSVDVPVLVDGKVAYALGIGILPEHVNAVLKAQGLPSSWVAGVFDRSGTIFGRTHDSERFVGQKAVPELLLRMMQSPEGSMEATTAEGIPVWVFYSQSPVTNWRVAIGIPRKALEAQVTHTVSLLALGVATVFAIGLGFAWFISRKIARSFGALVPPALALGSGTAVSLPSVDIKEAAEVTGAMGEAAGLLQKRTAALQAREAELAVRSAALKQVTARLEILVEHAPAAIAVFDRDMRYLAVSRRWLEDYRLTETTVIGRSHYEIFPDLPERWKQAHRRGLAGEVVRADADRFERSDGSALWIRSEVWPWRDDTGEVGGIVIAAEDITAQKHADQEIRRLNADLERRVEERTAELERSNEALMRSNMELGRFAHVAAHDLQTPLRSIAGFSQLLQREFRNCVDERAEDWLNRVIDNTRRLQTLIQELLAYSRLDAQAQPFEAVDMKEVFQEVVASLAAPIGEAGAEVHSSDLPTVMGDRIQMAQLLQNLIENGIRYNRSRPPCVSVSWERRDNEAVFAVADNGIGIDPKHHERIFEIFRRLHSHQEIPGTGIGLAICHRIVERHGGRIWVESEAGKGSVFHFSIPVGQEVA